jgi:hypothetical protein
MIVAARTTWSKNESEPNVRTAEVEESGLTATLRRSDDDYLLEVRLPSAPELMTYHSGVGYDDDQALVWAQDILDRLYGF